MSLGSGRLDWCHGAGGEDSDHGSHSEKSHRFSWCVNDWVSVPPPCRCVPRFVVRRWEAMDLHPEEYSEEVEECDRRPRSTGYDSKAPPGHHRGATATSSAPTSTF